MVKPSVSKCKCDLTAMKSEVFWTVCSSVAVDMKLYPLFVSL